MNFRLRAFGFHLLGSAAALTLALGALYAGWYRWPGWYLAQVGLVVGVLVGVDLALGPLVTLIIAAPSKPRRELTRDIALVVLVQLVALGYGVKTLWDGRPLYYAYSETVLQVVQAYDLEPGSAAAARAAHLDLAPHWYSLPRWIWAPLPDDPAERARIIGGTIGGGFDVSAMPNHFRPWAQGLPTLRAQLDSVENLKMFSPAEKKRLVLRMRTAGLDPQGHNAIPFSGRSRPLLAVFDPATLRFLAILESD